MNSLHFRLLTVDVLLLSDYRLSELLVLLVVDVVEFMHFMRGPVRIVPDK